MGVLGIIAGLILILAGSAWFTGAVTVGWVLLIAGAVITLAQIAFGAIAYRKVKRNIERPFPRYR